MCGCLTSLAQYRNGCPVAVARGALDVMSTICRKRTAGGQGLAAPFVRAQSPRRWRRFVDGPANERMSEAKAPGHVSLTNEVEAQQFIHGGQRRSLAHRR